MILNLTKYSKNKATYRMSNENYYGTADHEYYYQVIQKIYLKYNVCIDIRLITNELVHRKNIISDPSSRCNNPVNSI